MRLRLVLFVGITIVLAGCSGLRFSPITYNKEIPDDLKNRTFWKETDIFKYKLNQLTGTIIYSEDEGKTFKRGPRAVDKNSPPTVQTVKNGLLYHSKINRNFESNVSVLTFSGSLANDQMVEIRIIDLLHSFLEYEKIPIAEIRSHFKENKLKGKKAYYVQGALLTSITRQNSKEISANSKGVVGSAFGADGKVYNEETTFVQDYRISMTLIDVEELIDLMESKGLMENESERVDIIKASVSSDVSIESISGF